MTNNKLVGMMTWQTGLNHQLVGKAIVGAEGFCIEMAKLCSFLRVVCIISPVNIYQCKLLPCYTLHVDGGNNHSLSFRP